MVTYFQLRIAGISFNILLGTTGIDTQVKLQGYFEHTLSEDSVFIDSFCGQWVIYARYQGAMVRVSDHDDFNIFQSGLVSDP